MPKPRQIQLLCGPSQCQSYGIMCSGTSRILAVLLGAVALVSACPSESALGSLPSRTWNYREIVTANAYASPPFNTLAQSVDGLIYAGDQSGVLEFDGNQWRRITIPTRGVVTALGLARDGSVVVGGNETLLVLSRGDRGFLGVSPRQPWPSEALRGLGHVWEFGTAQDRWCVRTEPALLCVDDEGPYRIDAKLRFGRLFVVEQQLYVRSVGQGLMRLNGRNLELAPGGAEFADRGLASLSGFQDGSLLAITSHNAEARRLSSTGAVPFRLVLSGNSLGAVGVGRNFRNGYLALPSDDADVLIIAEDGHQVARIQASAYGAAPGAQDLLVAEDGALWIAWQNALSRVEYPGAYTLFAEAEGLPRPPTRISSDGLVQYTSLGGQIYQMDPTRPDRDWRFSPLPEQFPAILRVMKTENLTFVATMQGLFAEPGSVWPQSSAPTLFTGEPVLTIAERSRAPATYNVGLRFGIARLHWDRAQSRFQVQTRLNGIGIEVADIEEEPDGDVWVGSNVGRVIRFSDSDRGFDVSRMTEFGLAHGLPSGGVGVALLDREAIFYCAKGVLQFADGQFVPHPKLPFPETGDVGQIAILDSGHVLVYSEQLGFRMLTEQIDGVFRHTPSVFDQIVAVGRAAEIVRSEDGIVWIASDTGLIRVDPKTGLAPAARQQVLIREMSIAGESIFGGHGALPQVTLPEGSSIRFGYALPSFRAPEMNRYRSRIRAEGANGEWSAWSNETRRDFTNLSAGSLLFEVEAEDPGGTAGGMASVPITVIAPWYKRTWATMSFLGMGLILLVLGVQWRVRALRARSAELERLVAIKTEALQIAATTDPLTGLWNRHRFGQWMRDEVPKINAQAGAADDDERVDLITCVIDLDHFKRVNDQHGHAAGDAVLKAVAERLLALRENGDLVFRFGGEEFVYLGVNRHRSEGKKLAEKIVHEIAQINVELESGVLLDPTASVGWSVYPFYREKPELFTLDFVLGVADRALYLAKQVGRNRAYGYVANISVDELDRTQADWRTQVFNRHTDFLKRV